MKPARWKTENRGKLSHLGSRGYAANAMVRMSKRSQLEMIGSEVCEKTE